MYSDVFCKKYGHHWKVSSLKEGNFDVVVDYYGDDDEV